MHQYITLVIRTNTGKVYYKCVYNLYNHSDNHRHAKHKLSYNYDHPVSYFLHSTGIVPRKYFFGSLNRNLTLYSSSSEN